MNIKNPFSSDDEFVFYSQQNGRRPLAYRDSPSIPEFSRDALTGRDSGDRVGGVEEGGVSDQGNDAQQKQIFPKENPLELEVIGQMLNTIIDELTRREKVAKELNQETLVSDYEQAIEYAKRAQESLNGSNYKRGGEYLLLLANHLKIVVLSPIGESIGRYRDNQINNRKLLEFWSMKHQIEFMMRVGFAFSSGNVSLQQFEENLKREGRNKNVLNTIIGNLMDVEGDLWDYYVESENSVFMTEAPDEYVYLKSIDKQIHEKVKYALDLIIKLKKERKNDTEIIEILKKKGISSKITSPILSNFSLYSKGEEQTFINVVKKKIRNDVLIGILKSYAKGVIVRYYYLSKINKNDADEYLRNFTNLRGKELFKKILKNAFLSIPSSLEMGGEKGDLLRRIVNVQSGTIAVRSFSTGLAITFPYDPDILTDHRSNILTAGISLIPASSGFLYLNTGGILLVLPPPVGRPRVPGRGNISLPSQGAWIFGSSGYGAMFFAGVPPYQAVDFSYGMQKTNSKFSTTKEEEGSYLIIIGGRTNKRGGEGGFYHEEHTTEETDYELDQEGNRTNKRLMQAINGWRRDYGALNIRNLGMVRELALLAYLSQKFTSTKYFEIPDAENINTSDGQGFFNVYAMIRLGAELHRIFMSYEEGQDLLKKIFKLNPAFSSKIGFSYEELRRKDNKVLSNTEYGLRYFYYLGRIFSIYFGIGDQGSILAFQFDKLAFALSAALDDTSSISTLEKFEKALKEHKEIRFAFVENTDALEGIRKGRGPGGIVIYLTPKKSTSKKSGEYDFGFDILSGWLGFLQGKNVGITSIGIKFYEEEKTITGEDGTENQKIEKITRIRFSAYAGNKQVGASFSLSDLFIGKSEDGTNIWGSMGAAFYVKWFELLVQYIRKREGGDVVYAALQNNKFILTIRGVNGDLKTISFYLKDNLLGFLGIRKVELYPAIQYDRSRGSYNASIYVGNNKYVLRFSTKEGKEYLLSFIMNTEKGIFGFGGLYIPNPPIKNQEDGGEEGTNEEGQGTDEQTNIIVPTRTVTIPYPGPNGQTSMSVSLPVLFNLYYQPKYKHLLRFILYYGGDPRKNQEVLGAGFQNHRLNLGFQRAYNQSLQSTSIYAGINFRNSYFYVQATWQRFPSSIPGQENENQGFRVGFKSYDIGVFKDIFYGIKGLFK